MASEGGLHARVTRHSNHALGTLSFSQLLASGQAICYMIFLTFPSSAQRKRMPCKVPLSVDSISAQYK